MEVTVTIPDEFVEQLIPAGSDASRVMLEKLVDQAHRGGRINEEEAKAILELRDGAQVDDLARLEMPFRKFEERCRMIDPIPEWIDDPEQVRLHAQIEQFIDSLDVLDLPSSENTGASVSKSLSEQYAIERKLG